MCGPNVMTGLTIASGLLDYAGQSQSARAQESANNRATELTIRNQNLQIKTLQNQEDEERRRATEALLDNSKEAEAVASTARVAAGESGVSGLSVDALLGDIIMQESQNKSDILDTHSFTQRQRQLDREGIGITAESQINQLPLVDYPGFLESATKTGVSAGSVYKTTTRLNT